jgi:hypothetical protein
MRQAFHIFRKDIRHLWPALSIALAIQILFTFFEMQPLQRQVLTQGRISAQTLIDFLLPLAWWYLITVLVHEESLPGDRQFWVTRPYSWKSLLAAKALFIMVFVNVPVLVADCFILTAQGFSVTGHCQALLWRHIPFTVVVLLPPLALGALTRNISQVIVAILLVVLRIVVSSIPFRDQISNGWTAIGWLQVAMDTVLLTAVLSAVVLIQYRRRLTWLTRALAAAFVVFPGFSIPLRWQLDWQARVKPPNIDGTKIRIAFDAGRGPRTPRGIVPRLTQIRVALPVTVGGSPEQIELTSATAKIAIQDNGRTAWASDWENAMLQLDRNAYWETILLPANVFASLRNKPVGIRMTAVVTAVRYTEFRTRLESGPIRVPHVGICESQRPAPEILEVYCRSAFLPAARTRTHADYPGWVPDPAGRPQEHIFGELADSPFPAVLCFSPVNTAQAWQAAGDRLAAAMNYAGSQLVFETQHPIAHFQTEMQFNRVQLDKYAVAVPQD